jgi:hypothetical protein
VISTTVAEIKSLVSRWGVSIQKIICIVSEVYVHLMDGFLVVIGHGCPGY